MPSWSLHYQVVTLFCLLDLSAADLLFVLKTPHSTYPEWAEMLCHNPQSININKTIQHRCDLNIHLESANCQNAVAQGFKVRKTSSEFALWKNTEGVILLLIIVISHLKHFRELATQQTFHNSHQLLFPPVTMGVGKEKLWLQSYRKVS